MVRKRILLSWIGHNDLRAMAESLPPKQREAVLKELSSPRQVTGEAGPIKTLLDRRSFDEIHLISNYSTELEKHFLKWLARPATVAHVQLKNPTDYAAIFRIADAELAKLKNRKDWADTEACIHLSPGTPAMAAVWLLLGKSRYPATFYQTYQGKEWVTDVPFDLTFDFLPELIRDTDRRLQHLLAESPAEVVGFQDIVGDSKAIRLAVGRAKRAALHGVSVLILGESGTEKELFARAIHTASQRLGTTPVSVNCAAISRELIESEMFGHRKGSFTGAIEDKVGAFERADKGTLFLDEVGECDLSLQAKLLRVLQPPSDGHPCDRVFARVGDSKDRSSNVRIIAATNKDLMSAVQAGAFREDLYYRLAAITIKIPPLRERRSDIPLIATRLLDRTNAEFHRNDKAYKHKRISDSAMAFVKQHTWPGNVRQLQNALLQAAVMTTGDIIQKDDIQDALAEMPTTSTANLNVLEHPLGSGFDINDHLEGIQKHYLRRAMREAGGNKSQAARLLGMKNYQTLDAQLDRLKIGDSWRK